MCRSLGIHRLRLLLIDSNAMVQDINNTGAAEKTASAGQDDPSNDEKRKKVGNYIILKTIGEGSFAKVRLGIHLITEMKVSQ